ncbi:hypothetical protein DFA_09281 [Cavenderia fasciculata]|uniref:Protein kinase domain-containing protein n=1 Tax=Cavenderia fasciculata TaxID=261658 RepID=F4Q769_CACFS|nr:uncharacterized protein DFA_09281 [Cavenderia fasciculata]EGG16251.1 hypothetical protein DFA_09281 [Cavenderia fasciculata]|eukprot:XP_004354635.1 hypothetical protein DFA_09281 [Cavenderia fasciculata]
MDRPELLGRGSQGEVIKCALKYFVKQEGSSFEKELEFFNKIKKKGIKDDHIVQLYGETTFTKDGKTYKGLAMELADKGTLFDFIKVENPDFSGKDLLVMLIDIASVMVKLHEANLIHRDIKPSNILIFSNPSYNPESAGSSKRYIAKLADFGTSKDKIPNSEMTKDIGTRYYKAPEIGGNDYTCKVDVYSFGRMCQLVLNIALMFKQPHEHDVIVFETLDSFVQLVTKCTLGNPDHRPTFVDIHSVLCDIKDKHLKEFGLMIDGMKVNNLALVKAESIRCHQDIIIFFQSFSSIKVQSGTATTTISYPSFKVSTGLLKNTQCGTLIVVDGAMGSGKKHLIQHYLEENVKSTTTTNLVVDQSVRSTHYHAVVFGIEDKIDILWPTFQWGQKEKEDRYQTILNVLGDSRRRVAIHFGKKESYSMIKSLVIPSNIKIIFSATTDDCQELEIGPNRVTIGLDDQDKLEFVKNYLGLKQLLGVDLSSFSTPQLLKKLCDSYKLFTKKSITTLPSYNRIVLETF